MEKEEATPFGNLFVNRGEFFVITVLPYTFFLVRVQAIVACSCMLEVPSTPVILSLSVAHMLVVHKT